MAKLILIVLGIVFAWWVLSRYRTSLGRKAAPPEVAEDMVCCAQCGVHLPRSESHSAGAEYYCSAEHLQMHRQS